MVILAIYMPLSQVKPECFFIDFFVFGFNIESTISKKANGAY
jgi:hypothetical protein